MNHNPDCAALFGGFNQFINLLYQTTFNFANTADSTVSNTARQAVEEAGPAGRVVNPTTGAISWHYGRSDEPGHNVYLNHRFFAITTSRLGQLTGLIHELLHNYGRSEGEISNKDIIEKCGTAVPSIPNNVDG